MKNVKLLMILIILLMVLVGCPNDNASQTENTGTAVQNKITSLQAVIDSDDTKSGDTIDLSQYSDITNYSANINKALTINGAGKDFWQAVITADVDGIGLTGMQNVGTLTTSASLGSGSLKISGSSLSNLNILGGGSHSISLFDNVTIDEVVVNKQITADTDDYVRVVLDKTAVLEHTIIKCSTLIDASGDGVILKNVTFDVGDGNVVTMIALSSKLTLFKVSKLVNGVLSYNDAAVSLTLKNDQVSEDGVTLVMPKGTKVSDLSADFVVSAFEMIAGATLEDDLKNAIIGSLTQKIAENFGETFEDDKLVEIILTGDSGIEIKVEDGPVTDTGTHQITYHLYNGMSVTASYSEYEPTAALTNAGRQGYAFTGWFEDETCSGEPLFGWNAGDRTGDVELWAGWEA
ncbi:MAG: InlB B-repeat-containing protein, partial [Spirochaetales bacterium]|nr:InlB B-repeat-containing protein [Spirochaetales bacterium]